MHMQLHLKIFNVDLDTIIYIKLIFVVNCKMVVYISNTLAVRYILSLLSNVFTVFVFVSDKFLTP